MTSDEAASKRVAFYQELVSGWVTTQIEADKQAMTLSGLAIGLLMVLHRSINTSHASFSGALLVWLSLWPSFLASACFT